MENRTVAITLFISTVEMKLMIALRMIKNFNWFFVLWILLHSSQNEFDSFEKASRRTQNSILSVCVLILFQLISHWCIQQSNVLRTNFKLDIPMAFYFKHILCIVNSLRRSSTTEGKKCPFSIFHLFYYILLFTLVFSATSL